MPEDPSTPTPDPSARDPRGPSVGSAFAGETTRSMSQPPPSGDETVIAPGTRFETVGDFEIISKLGQGGMGAVYRARQKSLDRQVALKILPATLEADADFVSRFQREARSRRASIMRTSSKFTPRARPTGRTTSPWSSSRARPSASG